MRDVYSQQVDALMMDMAKGSVLHEKVPQFRVSGFPYCPIRDLLFNERKESFSMDFYTSIGTAVHETAQKWVTMSGSRDKIMACWKIKETGEIIGPCRYEEIPKKYHNYTIEYEEITISYRGLSGHVDLLYEVLPNKFIVVDFKTTDLGGKQRKYPSNWGKFYPASRSSIIQISSYSTLLKAQFGFEIVAWCLVYVDRGKAIMTPKDYHKVMRPWNKAKHNHFLPFIDEACDNNKRLTKLRRILDKETDYSEEANKLLKRIVKNRPCVDEDSYDEWMSYKFYDGPNAGKEQGVKKGGCDLKRHCLKGSKSCYKAVLAKL